ncbi:MAG: hypothetical protein ACYDHP_03575, partial [Ferrimicrobium sp.]
SQDTYQGTAVYDIHVVFNSTVYDVKVSMASGTVLAKKVSSEQSPGSESASPASTSSEATNTGSTDQSATPSTPAPSANGVTYGVKLTSVPSAFQGFVSQALSQENGTLKWVKFSSANTGDIQANIKINLTQGGTVKVKDLFSPSNQLISQVINN